MGISDVMGVPQIPVRRYPDKRSDPALKRGQPFDSSPTSSAVMHYFIVIGIAGCQVQLPTVKTVPIDCAVGVASLAGIKLPI